MPGRGREELRHQLLMYGAVVPIEQRFLVLEPREDHLLAARRARGFDAQTSWRGLQRGYQIGRGGLPTRTLLGKERRAKEQETEGGSKSDFFLHANLLDRKSTR